MPAWRIPLFDTSFGSEEFDAVLQPLKKGWLTMGEEVLRLEEDLCEATGAAHAVAVASGTAALHLACAALELGPGDEVVCPTLTFVATASAARAVGADVRLCESTGPEDLNVDSACIEAQLSERCRAILVVHYAGFGCPMPEILALAEQRGIPVIEDCAHALFTQQRGVTLGLHGRVGCFSFYANKNATCGEGGALVTQDADLAARLRRLRSHGMSRPGLEGHARVYAYDVVQAGFNYRLDEMRAALARVQLRKLPENLVRRRTLFRRYARALEGTPIRMPFLQGRYREELETTGVHILPTLLPEDVDRAAVVGGLEQRGIQTSVHYPPIHGFTAYREQAAALPRTAALCARELSLPFYPAMSDDDVDVVTRELADVVAACPKRMP